MSLRSGAGQNSSSGSNKILSDDYPGYGPAAPGCAIQRGGRKTTAKRCDSTVRATQVVRVVDGTRCTDAPASRLVYMPEDSMASPAADSMAEIAEYTGQTKTIYRPYVEAGAPFCVEREVWKRHTCQLLAVTGPYRSTIQS